MERREIVGAFAAVRGEAVVVTSPGASSGLMHELRAASGDDLQHGARVRELGGHGDRVGRTGATRRRVRGRRLTLRGGAAARYDRALSTAEPHHSGRSERDLGNGRRERRDDDGEASLARADLAVACGWPSDHVPVAGDPATLAADLRRALAEAGLWFVVAQAKRGAEDRSTQRQRNQIDPAESILMTRRDLRERR